MATPPHPSSLRPPEPGRRRLPVRPSAENLRKQAKRRAKTDGIPLANAQHALARAYGCRGWAELMHVVETMLRGADQTMDVRSEMEALPTAANANDRERVRAILDSGAFTQHDLDLALARSVLRFDERGTIARLLLEHGADPDGQYGSGYGPIVFGCGESLDVEGLRFLLHAGCDVTFPRIDTKYGPTCPLDTWLGTYVRGRNDAKHAGVELLLSRGAVVPPDVTPPILAIHRGDARGLAQLLDREPSLARRTFRDMPYGNIKLAGGTLLHCAVEFGEIACAEELLKRHADVNARAETIDGVGGQTPIFHAIHTNGDGNLDTLRWLVDRAGPRIDLSVRATWRGDAGWAIRGFDPTTQPMTPLEYAERAARGLDPKHASYYPRKQEEMSILRSLERTGTTGNA